MSGPAIQSDWVGRVIDGRFPLLQWLGGGERSAAFVTELPGPLAKKASIKLIPDDGAASEEVVAGWALARPLSHRNLMRLIYTGRCDSEGEAVLYAVAEYADEVLSEILPERTLTPTEAKEMLGPVVDVLGYLHGKGLVHGHLKPSNVLVVDDQLRISGDGLRAAGETGRQAAALTIYDAPERANGTISTAGDAWSLGVMLVEVLTQRPPVWDKSAGGVPVVPESIPEPLAGIARECLRVDPASRCSLRTVKTWLETGKPGTPESEAATGKKLTGRFGVAALVAAVVVVAAVVTLVEMRPKAPQEQAQTAAVQPDVQPAADTAATPATEAQDQASSSTPAAEPRHEEQAAPAPQKPSPAVAAAPVQQAPASEAHASKPIVMQDMNANGAVAHQVMPEYQPKALDSIHGKFVVKVRVNVDPAGNVTSASYESEGPSGYFAKSALEAAKQWKFKPAGGPSKWVLQFLFTHEGAQVTPQPAQ